MAAILIIWTICPGTQNVVSAPRSARQDTSWMLYLRTQAVWRILSRHDTLRRATATSNTYFYDRQRNTSDHHRQYPPSLPLSFSKPIYSKNADKNNLPCPCIGLSERKKCRIRLWIGSLMPENSFQRENTLTYLPIFVLDILSALISFMIELHRTIVFWYFSKFSSIIYKLIKCGSSSMS